jgi:hypothetical protein
MVHAGETTEEFPLLDELGVSWVLSTFYWSRIEPAPEEWDFTRYDSLVDNCKNHGKKILAVLAYDTPWLYKNGKTRKYISPENLPRYLRFVEETVNRYRGKVDAWEIWNEPNWFFWKGPKKDYFELARVTAQRIRELDPETPVLLGAFWRTPNSFIREMFKYGALENAKAIAFHPYGTTPKAVLKLYDDFLAILEQYHFTGDIWVTEVGYPTGGLYPNKTSENKMPSTVVKTLTGIASRGARAIFWYQFFDPYNQGKSPEPLNSEDFFGLIHPDYSKKGGAEAYALCARYLAGTQYRPDLPERTSLPNSVVSFYFQGQEGRNVLILWNNKNSNITLKVLLPLPGQRHDIVSGLGHEIPQETTIILGNTPEFITWRDEAGEAIPRISLP